MTLCAYIDGPWDETWKDVPDEHVGRDFTAFNWPDSPAYPPDNTPPRTSGNGALYLAYRYLWLPAIGKVLFMDDDDRDCAQYLDSAEQGWMYVYGNPATEVVREKLRRMLESRQP